MSQASTAAHTQYITRYIVPFREYTVRQDFVRNSLTLECNYRNEQCFNPSVIGVGHELGSCDGSDLVHDQDPEVMAQVSYMTKT